MLNRREFLRVAMGGVVLFFQAACQSSIPNLTPRASNNSESVTANSTAPTSPAGAVTPDPNLTPPKLDLPLPLELTPIEKFYVTSFSDTIPGFDGIMWSFSIEGLVERPLKFTFDELRALPVVEIMRTLECIGNPLGGSLIGNALWKGTSLKALLQQAGIKTNAKYLIMDGADDYYTTVPIDVALTDEALLAYEMNGQPLTAQHGRPIRVLLPGLYGQKQPKWLTHLEVADHYEKGPWEEKGWSDEAKINPNARIDRPWDAKVITGKIGDVFTIAGIAFAGAPGVARVEISTDDGKTWNDVTMTQAAAPFTNFVWTRWGYQWQLPTSGKYVIMARVTDKAGKSQSENTARFFANAFPDGTDAMPLAVVEVRTN